MKIKFKSDDELPLNKTIEIPSMTIVVRANFYENNIYYPQNLLGECLYKSQILSKCYISIELTFLKELMLIKRVHQKSMIFVTIDIFLNYSFMFQQNDCNRCHDLLISL